MAATQDSLIFLPIAAAVTTALAMAYNVPSTTVGSFSVDTSDDMLTTNAPRFAELSNQDEYCGSCVCRPTGYVAGCNVIEPNADDVCYYLFEWTSSTGFFCFLVLSYCLLIAVIHSIACYKFIVTWYLITGSLREQQYYTTLRCLCRTGLSTPRRRTCQEALTVVPYRHVQPLSPHATKNDGQHSCPICLMELQDDELVTLCDGCTATFHKDCLFDWLEFKSETTTFGFGSRGKEGSHTSCPCCRKEMLELVTSPCTTKSGWLTDISTYMGYYTR